METISKSETKRMKANKLVRSVLMNEQASITGDNNNIRCRIFCHDSENRKITYLATLSDFVTHESLASFSSFLSLNHKLTVISLSDMDPTLRHLNLHVKIPTHLIVVDEEVDIRKNSHVIHISIFHDRVQGKYWWQAPIKMNENQERILHRQGLKRMMLHNALHLNAIYAKTTVLHTTIDGLNISLPYPVNSFLNSIEKHLFIDNDLKRAAEFHAQFPKEESYEANQFRNKATALLTKVHHLLENNLHIPFWLSSGTLLGYYRQCDFITYSGDVDIGIWAQDFRPEIIETFSAANIPLIHWFGRPNDSLELSFLSGDLKLDIFFFYRESDHFWNGGTQARTGLKFKYSFPKFTLCWTEFIGLLLRIPCETESYLEANYGKQWFVPTKNWDWKSSPPNVKPNGQWESREWPETIRLLPLPDL